MECSKPGTIRDEEIVAYLAGENVRPIVEQHLDSCERCSSQLATYKKMEITLLKKLYRWDCPPSQMLGEYQLGMLSRVATAKVSLHLNTCILCAAEVASLTEFLTNDPMLVESVPVPHISVAARSFHNNHHPVQDAKRTVEELLDRSLAGARRIIATLVPQQPRLAGQQRDLTPVAAWPRSYHAEDLDIMLQIERGPSRRDALQLVGLVKRKGTALNALQGTAVQLLAREKITYTQTIDELGNFIFSSIDPATYSLELQFPERIVVIDQIAVTAQE